MICIDILKASLYSTCEDLGGKLGKASVFGSGDQLESFAVFLVKSDWIWNILEGGAHKT